MKAGTTRAGRIDTALALALALAGTAGTAGTGCTRVGGAVDEFRDADAPPRVLTADDIARRVIDVRDVERHVAFLASDELRGRPTPGRGLERAGAWVAERFQLAGLEPAGDDGGYVQYWPTGAAASPPPPPADSPSASGAPSRSAASEGRAPNVVGLLPGAELTRAGEYVVLVAHLDHLGVGEPDERGDSIYNGADDNATGVAALVEIAAAFAALPVRPARPVAFVAVSGREGGLRGSRWFVDHATLDLSKAVAVVNLDMIGRNHPDTVAVLGEDGPGLADALASTAASRPGLRLTVVRSGNARELPAVPTDHAPFAGAGIPAITVSTGLHEDYHRPADEARRVDADKAMRIARLVFLAAHALAGAPGGP